MGGGTVGANTQTISKAKYRADERARQYKRDKIDPATESAQRNFGQASGAAYDSFDMAMKDSQEIIRRNTESLPGTKGPYREEEDTSSSEANYTSSSSGSKSGGQGGKKDSNLKEKNNKQNLSKKALIK